MTEPSILLLAALCFLGAGTVKGVVGIGLPTTAIGLMTLFVDPRLAITWTLIPMLGSNAWQVWRMGDARATLYRYRWFAGVLAVGVALTTLWTRDVAQEVLMAALGLFIVIFVILNVVKVLPRLPDRFDRAGQVVMGALSGVMGGLTAVWAPPMVIYLTARDVDKDAFVRATGVLIFVGCVPLVWGYAQTGFLNGQTLWVSVAMLVPTILGFSLGERIRAYLPAAAFRKVLLGVFLILGLNLIRRSVF